MILQKLNILIFTIKREGRFAKFGSLKRGKISNMSITYFTILTFCFKHKVEPRRNRCMYLASLKILAGYKILLHIMVIYRLYTLYDIYMYIRLYKLCIGLVKRNGVKLPKLNLQTTDEKAHTAGRLDIFTKK